MFVGKSHTYAVVFHVMIKLTISIPVITVADQTRSTHCGGLLVRNQATHVAGDVKIGEIESNQAPRCATLTNT